MFDELGVSHSECRWKVFKRWASCALGAFPLLYPGCTVFLLNGIKISEEFELEAGELTFLRA